MILAIGGPPGSGKTTVAEHISRNNGYALVSAGAMFRKMAKDRRMTLEEFGRFATEHPEVDRGLDARVVAEVLRLEATAKNVVVEGRLAAQMLARKGADAYKVWIDAPIDVRAERIAGRDGVSFRDARRAISERERLEKSRYKKFYEIDLRDTAGFDLVIDSGDRSPDEIAADILARVAG